MGLGMGESVMVTLGPVCGRDGSQFMSGCECLAVGTGCRWGKHTRCDDSFLHFVRGVVTLFDTACVVWIRSCDGFG